MLSLVLVDIIRPRQTVTILHDIYPRRVCTKQNKRCPLYGSTAQPNTIIYAHMPLFFYYFRPRNGSPSATNVVVVLLVVSIKTFSFHNRSS